jgi:hypothetical protein
MNSLEMLDPDLQHRLKGAVLVNLTLCLGVKFHAVLEQERRVGVRRPVLGGLHVRGDAVRPRQEP